MHQVRPVEFANPSEETVWYLAFDESAIYLAAHAFSKQPGSVVNNVLRQGDSIGSDDSLRVLIDATNTQRTGYQFALNPNGVRYDGIYSNGTHFSDEWDGIWRGQAQRTSDGWTIEMEIPFQSLSFRPDQALWRINLWREISANDEIVAWTSSNGRIDPTTSGLLSGISNLRAGRGIEVSPSLSTEWHNMIDGDTQFNQWKPSVDVDFELGDIGNLLLTVNTDFAATEVDDRDLGLRRFQPFFPEKRTFFLTNFDVFQFGGIPPDGDADSSQIGMRSEANALPFFSRRIGLSNQREPIDLLYGAKFGGHAGDWDLGMLYVRQDAHGSVPETDLVVARALGRLFDNGAIGFIATEGDPTSAENNSLLGLDFHFRNDSLLRNRTATVQGWLQQSSNADQSGSDSAYSLAASLPSPVGFEFGMQFQSIGETFRPPIGFVNRVGVELVAMEAGYSHIVGNANFLREIASSISYERWSYIDTGDVQSEDMRLQLMKLESAYGDSAALAFRRQREGLLSDEQPLEDLGILIPAGSYAFNRYTVEFETSDHRPLAAGLELSNGDYYTGDRLTVSPSVEWYFNRHMRLKLDYEFNRYSFAETTAETHELELVSTIAFTSHASLITQLQYDNLSENLGLNVRFRYNVEAGRDLWLVVSHDWEDHEVHDQFRSTESSVAAKIRYTYRF